LNLTNFKHEYILSNTQHDYIVCVCVCISYQKIGKIMWNYEMDKIYSLYMMEDYDLKLKKSLK
jgi:hypothetical protein